MRRSYRPLAAIIAAPLTAMLAMPTGASADDRAALSGDAASAKPAADTTAEAGVWEPAETIASGNQPHTGVSHALAVGPGGRATLAWVEDDTVYAKRKAVAGDWSDRREIGSGNDVRAHTLGNGVTVLAAIDDKEVAIYRWGQDDIIRPGAKFRYEYLAGDIQLVGNNQGDLMLQ